MAWPGITVSSAGGIADVDSGGLSWSHTCGSGDTKLLLLIPSAGASAADAVSAVTYNSVAMTLVPSSNVTDGGVFERVQMWYMDNPPSGAHTASVTYGDIAGNLGIGAYAISFNGSSLTLGTVATNTATTANPSVTVASVSGDIVVSLCANDNSSGATTQGGTLIGEDEDIDADSDFSAQYQTASGTSTVCSWTQSGSGAGWVAVGVAVKQASGGGSTPTRRTLTGVGAGLNLLGLAYAGNLADRVSDERSISRREALDALCGKRGDDK